MKQMRTVTVHLDAGIGIGAGVGVAADVITPIDHLHSQVQFACQTFGHGEPVKPRTDDENVDAHSPAPAMAGGTSAGSIGRQLVSCSRARWARSPRTRSPRPRSVCCTTTKRNTSLPKVSAVPIPKPTRCNLPYSAKYLATYRSEERRV